MARTQRWTILAVGVFAQAATCSFLYGMPMLIPAFRHDDHLSLFQASLMISAPIVGLLFTLIAWGALADRFGERVVIASGVGASAVLLAVGAEIRSAVGLGVMLVLAGAAAASVNAASGRMVMGWFPVQERGLAMGIRQTAQPVGVATAAIALPGLGAHFGAHHALLFPAALCGLAALAVVALVSDPARPEVKPGEAPPSSPYRGSWTLGRVHLASSLLVIPQFAVSAFTLAYLVGARHWDPAVAGRWIFGFQAAGAVGRVVTGIWSDKVRSRLRPMRQLAFVSMSLMGLLAIGAALDAAWIVVVFALSAVVTVADNGLAYTSVAEIGGHAWAGRALGVHNTSQNVTSLLAAPMLAAVISGSSYAWGFALTAVFPLLAMPLTPVRAETSSAGELVRPRV